MSEDTSIKFETGSIRMSRRAAAALGAGNGALGQLLSRHAKGEWGLVPEGIRMENERALRDGGPVLSAYPTRNGPMVCILTGEDRSISAVFLFSELQEVLR